MLSLFDTPSLERALSLPLDRKLRQLLNDSVTHINELDFDVRETTYYLVVPAGCSAVDVADELGWSPLVSPLDGSVFGSEEFQPYHDFLADQGGWFQLIYSAGNDAAFVIFVQDDGQIETDLLVLCRRYVTDSR
ncbi:hypothetical protein [Sphingomonas sp.]|uniref:hypothetical protein n=1 Tax=Sphingomonas sp. TaxID=28214 RepID=UPI003CC56A0D